MLATKRITWTQPPEANTLDALYELEELEREPEGNEARVDELRSQLATVMAEEWRFTVGGLSVLTKSRYFAHLRNTEPYLAATWPDEDDPERTRVTLISYQAALVLASISYVEWRKRAILDGDSAEGWDPAQLPAGWDSVEGYMAAAPASLHDALSAAASTINPQVMMRGSNEHAKKYGGVSGS